MNKMYTRFTEKSRGCWCDGCFGDSHLRDILKGMLKGLGHTELAKVLTMNLVTMEANIAKP